MFFEPIPSSDLRDLHREFAQGGGPAPSPPPPPPPPLLPPQTFNGLFSFSNKDSSGKHQSISYFTWQRWKGQTKRRAQAYYKLK